MTAKYQIKGCIGCGVCSNLKPEIFSYDEDGMAEINDKNANDEEIKEAADQCPAGAIVTK